MRRPSRARLSIAVVILLAVSRGVHAQGEPTAEAAIGYAFLHDGNTDIDFPFGWIASIAGNATSWLALVGEVGGSYKQYSAGTTELSLKQHTFAAGPRFTVPATAAFAPFAQILFGIAHGSADLGVPGTSIVVRGTSFLTELGTGIDFNSSTRRAIRVELANRRLDDEGASGKQWRLSAAFVFRN